MVVVIAAWLSSTLVNDEQQQKGADNEDSVLGLVDQGTFLDNKNRFLTEEDTPHCIKYKDDGVRNRQSVLQEACLLWARMQT